MTERDRIYDELCRVLTDYETEGLHIDDLYDMLVKIQRNWELITASDE